MAAPSVAAAIKAATAKLGSPYVWGADGPDTFDCSGLMVWAWEKAGVSLPRTSQQQAKYGTAVPLSKIRAGDLVTSDWGSGPSSHVGLYIGNGKLIHAPRPGRNVTVANLDATYRSKINAVRRVPGALPDGLADSVTDTLTEGTKGALEGDPAGGILGLLGGMARPFTDIGRTMLSVGKVAEFVLRLALPSTWVRIACGVLGFLLLLLGLGFLVREARGS